MAVLRWIEDSKEVFLSLKDEKRAGANLDCRSPQSLNSLSEAKSQYKLKICIRTNIIVFNKYHFERTREEELNSWTSSS